MVTRSIQVTLLLTILMKLLLGACNVGPSPALLPYSIRSFVVRETVGFIPLFPFIFLVMTEIERKYLVWRCRSSWHNKYLKYIDEWINNVLPHQLEYFKKERDNLIKTGTYND